MIDSKINSKRKVDIEEIIKPVKQEFIRFQDMYKQTLRSEVKLLNLVTQYIVSQRGKKIRPLIVLLTSGLFGNVGEISIQAAVVVEILHNATLVHDDVVDEAQFRRGEPTVSQLWKSKVSVLVGDYLLSKSLIEASELGELEIVNNLSDATRRMSQGEIRQIDSSQTLDIDENEYFKLIADKTAALFSSCCFIGSVVSGASENEKKVMTQFGEDIGIAFQIKDDLLDMLGTEKLIGKPKLADIANNRLTLPMIHSLSVAPDSERNSMMNLLKGEVQKSDIPKIMSFIERYEGFSYTLNKCKTYGMKAREALITFPESPYRNSLELLIEYVVTRSK